MNLSIKAELVLSRIWNQHVEKLSNEGKWMKGFRCWGLLFYTLLNQDHTAVNPAALAHR